MTQNNAINIQSANFTPGGSWSFGGSVSMSAIPSIVKPDLLFYDSATKVVSYGAANAAGFSDVFVRAISLFGAGFFTTDPNCKVMVVELFGAGGGGAGAFGGGGAATAGGGGGSGAYVRFTVLPPAISAGFAYTIGSPGAGGAPSSGGSNGGDSSAFGVTASGGTGAAAAVTSTSIEVSPSGVGGTVSGFYGTGVMIQAPGNPGVQGLVVFASGFAISGAGGNAPLYFMGGKSLIANSLVGSGNGQDVNEFCAGGGGAVSYANPSATGGNGGAGYLIVTQYI